MSGPFIFIGSYTVQQGKVEEVRKALQGLVEIVETNEPRLIAFNVYLDEEGNKVSVVQVHPDAASIGFHMKLVADHISGAFEYFEKTLGVQIYGAPENGVVDMIREMSEPGAPMTVMPIHEAGFTRTNAG
jgi:quinol monooxygenase YgiN